MHKKKVLLLVFCAAFLAGCVNAEKHYTTITGDRHAMCYGVAFGIISSIIVEEAYQKCKRHYVMAGWQEIAE